jgi:hypothetical protein
MDRHQYIMELCSSLLIIERAIELAAGSNDDLLCSFNILWYQGLCCESGQAKICDLGVLIAVQQNVARFYVKMQDRLVVCCVPQLSPNILIFFSQPVHMIS